MARARRAFLVGISLALPVGLALFGTLAPARPRTAAAVSTTWTLIQATCPQGQAQIGRGCWTAPGSSGYSNVSDGSATYTDDYYHPPAYSATFSWTVPAEISGSGATVTLGTTAKDISNTAGLDTQICVTSAFSLAGNPYSCARADAQVPGSTDGPHTVNLTLLPNEAPSGTQVTVSIAFGAGFVDYTYRASEPAPPPTFENLPAPSSYGQTETAPDPAPGGVAVVSSPALATFGAAGAPVSVDVEGLSVRDQVIANARHDCFVQFVRAIRGLAAARLQLQWVKGIQNLDRDQAHVVANLAACLAFADAYAQQLYASSAAPAGGSCAEVPVKLSIIGTGGHTQVKSFRFGDSTAPLNVTCKRHAGGLTISVSTRSKHTPLSNVIGSRLRIGMVRAKSDTGGGQLRITFTHR